MHGRRLATRYSPIALLTVGSALSAFVGCEPAPPPVYPVSGTVTLDGKPMPEGEIAFVSVAEGIRDVIPIREGKFQGEVRPGQRRIEIGAFREEKFGVEMYGADAPVTRVNYVDPKFNVESKLAESVNTQAANDFKFEVTSRR